jgi:hypothetical protein
MAPNNSKRITENDDLNKILDEPGWKPAPASERRRFQEIARNTMVEIRKKHGGARPGAGRKPSGRKATFLNLLPETLAVLEREAGGRRGMGAVVDRLVAAGTSRRTPKARALPSKKK